jgi:hypothetical protein
METRNSYKILVAKSEAKKPLGRHRHRSDDNIKDLRERGWAEMDWIHLTEDSDQWRALVSTMMNLWVPFNVGKFMSS